MKKKSIYLLFLCCSGLFLNAQNGEILGIPKTGNTGISETVAEIMARNVQNTNIICKHAEPELIWPDRNNLAQNPNAPAVPGFPYSATTPASPITESPQTLGTNFTAATLSGTNPTGSFPPDDMGAVGPTQYIISVNGRIVSFNKTTGVADGALNTTQDIFFSSVMTPPVVNNFTSDPRIRYDRKSQKWIFIIIDVPGQLGDQANRVLIGVSNGPTITAGTVFTYFFFTPDVANFADYPTLGVDDNALYIGCNMFSFGGAFVSTSVYVVRKSSVMGAGPIVSTPFLNILVGGPTGAGPYTPQGVDNLDATSTDGYFIGADNATFSTLMLRRVTNPGTTPTLSGNISLTVPTTTSTVPVPHSGNTGGNNGRIDALDDRLYAAVQRNGHLWTSHSFRVSSAGVASTAAGARVACRWYDITNLATTPTLSQSGTVFDNAATNPVFYSIPTIMVSGQGHAAIGMTSAGLANFSNASTVGRLSTDVSGTTGTIVNTTTSSTAYNPPGDPGGASGRRWGDYSYVSLDPIDDQTMWMVHQFCDATNSYGCRVTKLKAPPPATPASCSPSSTPQGQASVNIVLTGTSVSGSGFYDPGTNLAGALPFNHISATVTGGVVVNSVTYTNPTTISLNINTVAAALGNQSITVTNPDGQIATSASAILNITAPIPVTLLDLKGKLNSNMSVLLNWSTTAEYNNKGFYIERNESNNLAGWTSLGFINGAGYSNLMKNYSFTDNAVDLNKIYRYRLKQMDFNGVITYSTEVVIRVKDLQKNNLLLNVYPNPVADGSTIRYNLPSSCTMSLKMYDILGKEIKTLADGYQQQGAYFKQFDAEKLNLQKGIYLCKLTALGESVITRIIVIK